MPRLKTIVSLVLIFCALRCECAQVDFEDIDIEAGKGALTKIQEGLGKLKQNTIFKNVVTAGKVLGHTAVAIQNIVALIKSSGESKELKFMKEQFAKINTKLDVLEFEFQDIKNLIDWTTMKVNVGEYERIIKGLEVTHANYMNAPPSFAEIYSKQFIAAYERQYHDAALKLYNAMASDGIFQENIIAVARRQFEEHKPRITRFVSYILLIIQRGVILETTYYAMKGDANAKDRVKTEWQSRFKEFKGLAKKFDKEIFNAWSTQFKIDLNKFITKNAHLDKKQTVSQLSKFLRAKYPGRIWFVFVYTSTDNNPENSYFDHCNGWDSGKVGNKGIIVNSMSYKDAKRRKSNPNIFFKNLRTRFTRRGPVAKILFDQTPSDCRLYHFKGVFETKSEPYYGVLKNHLHHHRLLVTRHWTTKKYYRVYVVV